MATAGAIRAGKAFVELFADDSRLVQTLRHAENKVRRFGANIQSIGRRLATLGLAASIPFGIAVKTFASFDDQMRAVKASTGATGKEFDELTAKAKLLGRTTSFTAAEVAGAMLELGRAGFDPKMIDAAITSVLDLARATGTELADATQIAVNTMYGFELPATEMTRVCDVMVAAANGSAQTLTDLGEAMSYCAPIASEYGLSLEQTAKALGSLANYGIKASQAGTTLRRILTNLADPAIQKRLQGLGVNVVDFKTGKLRDVSVILRDLGKAVQNMPKDQKLGLFKELFDLYAIAGGAKLTVAQFDKLIDAVDNAGGASSRTAKEMDAGLGGSFRMMWSAIEGVAIAVGESLNPSLKKMTDWFTAACSGVAEYITKHQELIVKISKTITLITGIGVALFVVGAAFVGVGNMIGMIATIIGSFAKIALFGLNMLQMGINLVSGAFTALSFTISSMVSVFSAVASGIFSVFLGIGTALGAVFSVVSTIGAAVFSVLGAAIGAILSPIGLAILGVSALAAACVFAYRNADKIGEVFSAVFSQIGNIVKNATSGITKFFGDAYQYLSKFYDTGAIIKIVEGISWCLQQLGKIVGVVFRFGVSCVFNFTSSLWNLVKTASQVGIFFAKTLIGAFSTIIKYGISIGIQIGNALISGLKTACSAISSIFKGIAGIIQSVFGTIVQKVSAFLAPIISVFQSAIAGIKSIFSGVVSTISQVFSSIFSVVGKTFERIIGFARKFFVFEAVVQTVYFIGKAFYAVGQAVASFFGLCQSAVKSTPGIVSGIVKWFQNVPGMIGGMFSKVVGVAKTVVSSIGNVFSGIAQFAVNVWSGLTGTFSSIFTALGTIVSGFGNFFNTAFANVGTAVDWLKTQFQNLCTFATETFGAIVKALGRGDIEAALQVVWASLKLIWMKGSTGILSTWYWVIDTLQTAWATCVYKLSEILTNAWYGVQSFWVETVYTMSTIWQEFSSGVVSAWKTAEKAVAKGIGYLMAKMQGLDFDEMSKILDEDYNRQSQQREADKTKNLTDIQNQRDTKISSLENDQKGVLDVLKSDFEKNSSTRDAAYQAKLAAQEQELSQAKAAYDEAINRAKNPEIPEGKEQESVFDRVKAKVQEVMRGFRPSTDLESKISVSGSFSAAAISSMGASSTMDRVAKATEKSEKHLEKIANKDEKADSGAKQKKELHTADQNDKDPAIAEMKVQTRLLRDISTKGTFV